MLLVKVGQTIDLNPQGRKFVLDPTSSLVSRVYQLNLYGNTKQEFVIGSFPWST